MSCMLRVADERFDVDLFLASSSLTPHHMWHVGEQLSEAAPPKKTNGLNVEVSDAEMDDLPAQIADAIEFLRQHPDELKRLSAAVGASGITLDFAVAHRGEMAMFRRLPPELIRLAAQFEMEIELSIYACE